MQRFGERNQVDRLLAFAERDHLIENAAVLLQEKIFGLDVFDGGVQRVIIEQNGAENGAFGVEILRQWALESGLSRHSSISVFAFNSLYSILPCGRQARFAEIFRRGLLSKDRMHCDGQAARRQ